MTTETAISGARMPAIRAERTVMAGSSRGPKLRTTSIWAAERSAAGRSLPRATRRCGGRQTNPTTTQNPTVTPAASVGANAPE